MLGDIHEVDVVKMETSMHINEIWEEPMPVRQPDVCSQFEVSCGLDGRYSLRRPVVADSSNRLNSQYRAISTVG